MGQEESALPLGAGRSLPVRRFAAAVVLALAALAAAGYLSWQSGVRLEDLTLLGYPGVFLIMLLSGSGVFVPVGGQAAVLMAGALWNPLAVGLVAGLGNAVGELTGYAAGRLGAAALARRRPPRWWSRLKMLLARYGFFAILVLAAIPNPVFDVVGLLAGSTAYPLRRFWLACVIGNSIKYGVLAYLGDNAGISLG